MNVVRCIAGGRALHRNLVPNRYFALSATACTTNMSSQVNENRPVENLIRKKLIDHFQPHHLDILNESHKHKVPKGSELHFRVVVVSEKFTNTPLLERHRMVYKVLEDEKKNIIALSILAKTPDQWEDSEKKSGKSPPCLGGAFL